MDYLSIHEDDTSMSSSERTIERGFSRYGRKRYIDLVSTNELLSVYTGRAGGSEFLLWPRLSSSLHNYAIYKQGYCAMEPNMRGALIHHHLSRCPHTAPVADNPVLTHEKSLCDIRDTDTSWNKSVSKLGPLCFQHLSCFLCLIKVRWAEHVVCWCCKLPLRIAVNFFTYHCAQTADVWNFWTVSSAFQNRTPSVSSPGSWFLFLFSQVKVPSINALLLSAYFSLP